MNKIRFILFGFFLLLFSAGYGAVSAASSFVPMPGYREAFVYSAVANPLDAKDLSQAKPVGIGPLAEGGDMLSLSVTAGPFAEPVNMYITLLSPDDKLGPFLSLNPNNTFEPLSDSSKPWREKVAAADEFIMDMPVSSMSSGPYVLIFAVIPAGDLNRCYLWTVPFLVP